MKKRVLAALLCALVLTACAGEEGSQISEELTSSFVSSEESGEEPMQNCKVKIGDVSYTVTAVNAPAEGDGVYLYDAEAGEYDTAGDGTDVAVVNNTVVQVGKNLLIPDCGYVLRFVGTECDAAVLGATARLTGASYTYLPEMYVQIGKTVVEVGYKNTTRTAEQVGFLFDDGWYADSTCSNIWGMEIAVDAAGTVVTVNPSCTETSGNTEIPAGGYVLSVGADTAQESALKRVRVGDTAEFVERTALYKAKRYSVAATDADRAADAITVYTPSYGAATPAGSGLTEVSVDANGRIIGICTNSEGGNAIPTGGFVLSAAGTAAASPASVGKLGMIVTVVGKTAVLIDNPETVSARLQNDLTAVRERYLYAAEHLTHIDFASADAAISDADAAICQMTDSLTAETLLAAVEKLKTAEQLVIPCLTVQNREAWVTVGELNYDGSFLLHYTDQADVDRAAAYAKRIGVNTLIIDNTVNGYAVYPSQVAGMVMLPALNGFDVIDAFSKACKAEGLKLTVMVNAFSTASASLTYPEEHYVNLYADCVMVSKNGNTVDASGGITLEPSEPAVQEFNLAVASELVSRYEIDGFQADYIRYPLPIYYQIHNYEDFGYESPISEAFEAAYGIDPKTMKIDNALWDAWCAYRRDAVSGYAKRLYNAVKAVDDTVEVSFTCFADYRDRQVYVYQDVELWAADGYADAIYPMIYGADTEYQQKYANEIAAVASDAGLVLGVGFYVRASEQSIIEQLYLPFSVQADGVGFFTLRYVSYCGYDEAVRRAFYLPATPSGTADSASAAVAFLAERVRALRYLCEDPALDDLLSALGSVAPTEAALAELRDTLTVQDETLKAALRADFDYAMRFV